MTSPSAWQVSCAVRGVEENPWIARTFCCHSVEGILLGQAYYRFNKDRDYAASLEGVPSWATLKSASEKMWMQWSLGMLLCLGRQARKLTEQVCKIFRQFQWCLGGSCSLLTSQAWLEEWPRDKERETRATNRWKDWWVWWVAQWQSWNHGSGIIKVNHDASPTHSPCLSFACRSSRWPLNETLCTLLFLIQHPEIHQEDVFHVGSRWRSSKTPLPHAIPVGSKFWSSAWTNTSCHS